MATEQQIDEAAAEFLKLLPGNRPMREVLGDFFVYCFRKFKWSLLEERGESINFYAVLKAEPLHIGHNQQPDGGDLLIIDPTVTDGRELGPIPDGPSRLGNMGPNQDDKLIDENQFTHPDDPAGHPIMPERKFGSTSQDTL